MKTKNEPAPQKGQEVDPLPLTNEERRNVLLTVKKIETALLRRGNVFCFFSEDNDLDESGLCLTPNTVMKEDRIKDNLIGLLTEADDETLRFYTKVATMLSEIGNNVMTIKGLQLGSSNVVDNEAHLDALAVASKSFYDLITAKVEKTNLAGQLKDDLLYVTNASLQTLAFIYAAVLQQAIRVTNDGQYVSAVVNSFIHRGVIELTEESKQNP